MHDMHFKKFAKEAIPHGTRFALVGVACITGIYLAKCKEREEACVIVMRFVLG